KLICYGLCVSVKSTHLDSIPIIVWHWRSLHESGGRPVKASGDSSCEGTRGRFIWEKDPSRAIER
ncbi:MAG: hypothetical protein ACI9S8_002412, partial [Chlamydiales bacterium]